MTKIYQKNKIASYQNNNSKLSKIIIVIGLIFLGYATADLLKNVSRYYELPISMQSIEMNKFSVDQLIESGLSFSHSLATNLLQQIHVIVFIIIILLFRNTKIIITSNHSKLIFYPILIKWVRTVEYTIVSPGRMNSSLITYLTARPEITWSYTIQFDHSKVDIILEFSSSKRFFPVSTSKLKNRLSGLLASYQITGTFSTIAKKRSNLRYMSIQSKHSVPDISRLIQFLLRESNEYAEIKVSARFAKKSPVKGFDHPIPHFHTTIRVGIGRRRKFLRERIKSVLYAISDDIKVRSSAKMQLRSAYAWKILKFPELSAFKESLTTTFATPPASYSSTNVIGEVMVDGQPKDQFGLDLADLAQGGIIAGAIGTGKTTCMLHLIQLVLNQGIRVIDFGLKGDAPRYEVLRKNAIVAIPNHNYFLNPFECPAGYSASEYANILTRAFIDTIPDAETLTPPQKSLLGRAVHYTVEQEGNPRQFFENLLILGNREREVVDNYQHSTAQAIMVRFSWMQSSMAHIFWRDKSSLTEADYQSKSIFFDFSRINSVATQSQIQFLVNLIMARVMAGSAKLPEVEDGRPRTVIFVDEAQIMLPNRANTAQLSNLEQTVSTLRFKGLVVVAAGVSADRMSSILVDTGFVAQFKSESQTLQRRLNLMSTDELKLIPKLDRFKCIVSTHSTASRPVWVKINKFDRFKTPDSQYFKEMTNSITSGSIELPKFELNFSNYWQARLDSLFMDHISIKGDFLDELSAEARMFLDRESKDPQNMDLQDLSSIVKVLINKYRVVSKINGLSAKSRRVPQQFLLLALKHLFRDYILQFEYDKRIKLIDKNINEIVSKTIAILNEQSRSITPAVDLPQTSLIKQYLQLYQNGYALHHSEWVNLRDEVSKVMELYLMVMLRDQLDKIQSSKVSRSDNSNQFNQSRLLDLAQQYQIISQKQADHLHTFRKHRNQTIHGSTERIELDQSIIIKAASAVVQLKAIYLKFLNKLPTDQLV